MGLCDLAQSTDTQPLPMTLRLHHGIDVFARGAEQKAPEVQQNVPKSDTLHPGKLSIGHSRVAHSREIGLQTCNAPNVP